MTPSTKKRRRERKRAAQDELKQKPNGENLNILAANDRHVSIASFGHKSGFYNPTHNVSQLIRDALDPDKRHEEPRRFVRKRPLYDYDRALTAEEKEPSFFRYKVLKQTTRAVCMVIGPKTVWLPISQLIGPKLGRIGVPRWLVEAKGLQK